ncbi:serine carboxypeptidase-like 15 [Tasmannia lanceolata]|uniref:serine carboxypeptidase-like 15 n=1 Tax=Tasmannia lanceolata TaxID=3420 RepID=UPI004062E9CD
MAVKRTSTPTRNMYSSYLFLLILLSSSWLAISYTTVRYLPGFQGPLPFHLETGYIGVGEKNEDQLFYYFIQSEKNPKEDPLVLWLTGGPGCSAFSGLVYEIGPLQFDVKEYNGSLPTFMLNPYSWTKVANIIFLDQPVGTGFSYTTSRDYQMGDFKSAKEIHEFLRKWLISHPQFLSNPLYVGGDSYSGLTVPVLCQEISNGIEAGQEPILNLKGYFVGNPGTDPKFDSNSLVPFVHGMGLISEELFESAKRSCRGDFANPSNALCAKDIQAINQCLKGINTVHILEPLCFYASPKPNEMVEERRSLEEKNREFLLSQSPPPSACRSYGYLLSYDWANNNTVREAIQIRKGTIGNWERCNYGLTFTKDVRSSLDYHFNLTSRGYRALVYSGDHDMTVPFVGTQAWVRSLNFSIVDDWRSWSVDGDVAGYTRTYSNNLTFATVKGAGHTAPEYKPKECLAMLQRWISHNPL